MEIRIEEMDGGITVIRLSGRMDADGVREIDDQFAAATAEPGGKMIVDLSKVPFLASIGIRALLSASRAQINRGGKLALAAPQPMVFEVLDKTGIQAFVEVYDDIEGAKGAFED